jgi:uncharacterized delta-60 repeat protein
MIQSIRARARVRSARLSHASSAATTRRRATAPLAVAGIFVALLGVLLPIPTALAAAGDLDPSFGTGGVVTTDISGTASATNADIVNAVAIQADGKIVAVGQCSFGFLYIDAHTSFCLVRYNFDGSPDAAFGSGGQVVTHIQQNSSSHVATDTGSTNYPNISDIGAGVAIQSDGKIVAAGSCSFTESNADFCLARYNSDGSLDPSFGPYCTSHSSDEAALGCSALFEVPGEVVTDVAGTFGSPGPANADDFATGVAMQPDGHIVVVGYCQVGSKFEFCLARYNTDGNLAGTAITAVGDTGSQAQAVTVQSDGKILVVGNDGNSGFRVTRYNSDVTLDIPFGNGGTAFAAPGGLAKGVTVQGDGKIVVAGLCGGGAACLARLDTSGSPDPSFADAGTLQASIGFGYSAYYGVAVQGDGKIAAAGTCNGATQFCAARYNSDGSPDVAFGSGGWASAGSIAGYSAATAMALQGDGKIVVAGHCGTGVPNAQNADFCLARFDGGEEATLSSIAVTPADPTLPAGTDRQFTATGTYSDASTADLTSSVIWASDTPVAATIGATGLAHAVSQGTSTISATLGAASGNTILTVGPPTLSSIAVTPADPTLPAGTDRQFTATGTYSDASTADLTGSVTWASASTQAATIGATSGLAHGVAPGTSTISASLGAVSGSTTLTVGPATLTSIAVTPSDPTIAAGTNRQFTATGTYSDASAADLTASVTWASASPALATIGATSGLAHGVAPGTSTISATLGAVSGSTTLTVGKPLPNLVYTGPTAAAPSASITLSAKLTSGSGAVLSGRAVTFTFKGLTLNATTNKSGVASVKTIAPASTGAFPVGVAFAGDATHAATSTSASVAVQIATKLAYTGPTRAAPGAAITLSATLKTASGTVIAGKTVTFTLNGATLTATTNGFGVASLVTTAPATAGKYTIGIAFVSDATYMASSSSATLTIR